MVLAAAVKVGGGEKAPESAAMMKMRVLERKNQKLVWLERSVERESLKTEKKMKKMRRNRAPFASKWRNFLGKFMAITKDFAVENPLIKYISTNKHKEN